jgi:hypothetical protein
MEECGDCQADGGARDSKSQLHDGGVREVDEGDSDDAVYEEDGE